MLLDDEEPKSRRQRIFRSKSTKRTYAFGRVNAVRAKRLSLTLLAGTRPVEAGEYVSRSERVTRDLSVGFPIADRGSVEVSDRRDGVHGDRARADKVQRDDRGAVNRDELSYIGGKEEPLGTNRTAQQHHKGSNRNWPGWRNSVDTQLNRLRSKGELFS
jgi:hypothetical protein